jgi:asparagine synthetase B (glutamine-hydrolysing)
MGMAHGLEARVPFLDTDVLQEVYANIDPLHKLHGVRDASGEVRPEKWALRKLFEGSIPHEVLWRTKAMQCEGVGTNWVEILQAKCALQVSDAQFASAATTFPLNTPQVIVILAFIKQTKIKTFIATTAVFCFFYEFYEFYECNTPSRSIAIPVCAPSV